MDVKRAIDLIEDIACGEGTVFEVSSDLVKAIKMAMNALEASEWIPVVERFPEEREVVLACDNNGGITLAWYQCGRWFRVTSFTGDRNYIVDAWMPLPEPYRPET